MNKAASIKARIRNLAKKQGRSYQELLQTYALERTIYRISISPYKENFTLKGGIFLYLLFDGNFPRSTTDIDLLAQKISYEKESLRQVFFEVFSMNVEDGIHFDLESMNVQTIAEFNDIPGTRITITAYMERTRLSVTIDIGFGDCITPKRIQMKFPVLLDEPEPTIFAYSKETVIAEKLEAIVSLSFMNSRYKDFYDIFLLSKTFCFEGKLLQTAIRETFTNRNTIIDEIAAFEDQFISDPLHQKRWKAFLKKKNVKFDLSFDEVINYIKSFTIPIINSIKRKQTFESYWLSEDHNWKS